MVVDYQPFAFVINEYIGLIHGAAAAIQHDSGSSFVNMGSF